MKSTKKSDNEITLESIDEKLDKIKNEIDEIKKHDKDPKGYISYILLTMGFLLISFAVSITFQITRPSVEFLGFLLVVYLLFGLAFIWMSLKIMEKKFGKL